VSASRHHGVSFTVTAAIDSWEPACASFRVNFPLATVDQAPVTKKVLFRTFEKVGDIDVIIGGPPCQGFSTSGKRALDDPRNRLVREYLSAIELIHPRAFIMENVQGFTSFQSGLLFRDVCRKAEELGYNLWSGILLASRYGVPQRRRRFFLVGTKGKLDPFPIDRTLFPSESQRQLSVREQSDADVDLITFDDATSDLPRLAAGESSTHYRSAPTNSFQHWARKGSASLSEHQAPNHRESLTELMKFLKQGESALSPRVSQRIPRHLRPTSGFANSYRRIQGGQPAPTITRNFTTPSSANCIHPRQHRSLTLREGARCQSFRDSFTFVGTFSDKRLLIGNAVPPHLAQQLGNWLLRSLA